MHFLEDFQRHKKYTGFGDCGFTWQKLENRFMRNALSLKTKQQGVLVKKVCTCVHILSQAIHGSGEIDRGNAWVHHLRQALVISLTRQVAHCPHAL